MEPSRGELIVFKRTDPWRGCMVPVASLVAADGVTYVLPPLDQVRIARWQGDDLVLIGLEERVNTKGLPPDLQSWWVRLVRCDPGLPRTPPPGRA